MTNPAQIPDSADALAWALRYSKRGWRVLPIKPNEKRPPMSAWQDAATTEVATIENWWTQLYRGHGIGVATGSASGIFVLDVDVSDQKAGDETLASLEDRFGGLPPTPTVNTPSGGVHYYFCYPPGVEIRNDAGRRLGEGLDIRGDGGQVVAPPTTRAQGGYEWVEDTYLCDVAQAPRWLIEKVIEQQKPEPVLKAKHHAEGNGNSPADLYSERTNWPDLLTGDGWTIIKQLADGETHWTRPGKDGREGASATTGHKGNDCLTVFTTSIDWLPPGTYSRFGYKACRDFDGDRSACGSALFAEDWAGVNAVLDSLPVVAPKATQGALTGLEPPRDNTELAHLIEWKSFWDADLADEQWLAYPLIPKGRAISLYAEAKQGKSTVVLAVAAAVATGRPVLGHRVAEPVDILYLDYEMTGADLRERLEELGYGIEDDLTRLHYALLPSLPPLDTIQGAYAIKELVEKTKAEWVIFDTFGRSVEGEEDSADTVRAFYRHTGLLLKSMGVTYLRTDHAGKNVERGQRGSSAKNDDVDVVWQLKRVDAKVGTGVVITRTHSRISWVPSEVRIERRILEDEGQIHYILDAQMKTYTMDTWKAEAVLQEFGLETWGQNKAYKWLEDQGLMAARGLTRAAIRSACKKIKDASYEQAIPTTNQSAESCRHSQNQDGTPTVPKNLGTVPSNLGTLGTPLQTLVKVDGTPDEKNGTPDDSPVRHTAPLVKGAGLTAQSAQPLEYDIDNLF